NLYHLYDNPLSQNSRSIALEDTIEFSWAKDLDFSQVDYWFIPLHHGDHFRLCVVDNVQCWYDFLHSIHNPGMTTAYQHALEKAIGYIESYCLKMFGKVARRAYKWKELMKVHQRDETSSGMYVLNWCEKWEGKYQGFMSSVWRTPVYIEKQRLKYLTNLVLSNNNSKKARLVEMANTA
ncbi:hypothetical protein LINGRAHAP2_LOCUS24225, partial [Linum grandiflorum]